MILRSNRIILLALLALGLVGVVIFLFRTGDDSSTSVRITEENRRLSGELSNKLKQLELKELEADQTVWVKEILAQKCGRVFESFWDSLNASSNKLSLAGAFNANEFILGRWNSTQSLPHGIELRVPDGTATSLTGPEWRDWVRNWERAGWQLAQTEFRHRRFETDTTGRPRQSLFYFSAHLTSQTMTQRASVEGDLIVDWSDEKRGDELVAVKRIDASRLTVKTRLGEPTFKTILEERITPAEKSNTIDPLILYDLDGDGLSEILLPIKNLVYRRRADGHYESEALCRFAPGMIFTCVVADFDGDGAADLLCAKPEGLVLFSGSAQGTFDQPGRLVWQASPPLSNATVLTCGDIDRDGDLDVFLGQYKVPTLGQILRPHYYDANDGYPSHLLRNDGRGSFTDVTTEAGLQNKRWRRIFSASLVDLNNDGDLDLLTVSDFAGVDLYRNDGSGHFTDATREWIPEPHAFGMAHALADFNADGRLDLLMMGMTSATAERLEHLNLWPTEVREDRSMRSRMTFGNRLYVGRLEAGFEQTHLSEYIARSGWSWGCGAFDFDNDGFPDVYIANGMETKKSVRDYESEFWLHDIYIDNSVDDSTATAYFTAKYGRTRGQGWSYGGYEKNRLYLNQRGETFIEIGHLMGVALEQDSRCVVTDDLDGDGRVDLLVTTFEVWPEAKQTLRIYKNTFNDSGHWIGFRFREEGPGKSPVGARITIRVNGRDAVRSNVTGDSYRSQHANTVHFGLGWAERVDSAEIRWPNGQTVTLREPALNRYHSIPAPEKTQARVRNQN